jgi:GNAT superfamily N-acetyltransferase
MINIIPYKGHHQNDIDELMRDITEEFALKATHPTYKPNLPDGYWVALQTHKVIGTIGINSANGYAILKRMFLNKEFRGKGKGIAGLLLQTAIEWCREKRINLIYLGTMEQFKAAQKFYERNGFTNISENELPDDFLNNPLDSVFYKMEL